MRHFAESRVIERGWRRLFRLRQGAGSIRRDVDEELAFHLEMRTRKLIARGLPADAARAEARRRFGDVDAIRDRCLTLDTQMERAMRRADLLDELRRDAAYAVRSLRGQRGFTAVVVLTLGIGIGATTAIFSLVDALLLRPLPVAQPEQLVAIGDPTRVSSLSVGSATTDLFSYPLYRHLRERNRLVTGVLASGRAPRLDVVIAGPVSPGGGEPAGDEAARGRFVSSNYFSVLGVPMARGRAFTPDDRDGADEPAVVISHGYWKRRFALDPSAIGRTITVRQVPVTIIGVAREGFFGEIVGQSPDMWIPIGLQPQLMPNEPWLERRGTNWLLLMGRLAPGITVEQARSGFGQLARQALEEEAGRSADADALAAARQSEVEVGPGGKGFSRVRRTFGQPLLTLMGGAILVLLIVCANVANLMLARASARRAEIGVRLALGAARTRLVRQLLTESTVLAIAGGALGVLFAWWGSTALIRSVSPAPGSAPAPLAVHLDVRVLAFASAAALTTVLLFGLVPALSATRVELAEALKARTRGGTGSSLAGRGRGFGPGRLLVVAQVALSVLLLVGAGLLLRSTQQLRSAPVGYDRDGLLIVDVAASAAGYEGERLAALARSLLERYLAIPGVRGGSYSENGLFSGTESRMTVQIDGFNARVQEDSSIYYDHVGPGYASAIGARLVRGRDIGPDDNAHAPRVTVINESMARFYFAGQDPLGRRVRSDGLSYEIVGVVADVKGSGLREDPFRRAYLPYQQPVDVIGTLRYELRVADDVASVVKGVRGETAALDATLRVAGADPLVELMRSSIREERLLATLASIFGGLALLLAVFGLYGVMTYTIVRRTAEFGLRMALGARPGDVLSLVLRESLRLVALGIALGIPAAIATGGLLRSLLFGVTPADPLTLATVLVILIACATLAAFLPANRASRVAPLEALRTD